LFATVDFFSTSKPFLAPTEWITIQEISRKFGFVLMKMNTYTLRDMN